MSIPMNQTIVPNSFTSEFVFSAPAYLCLISTGRLATDKGLKNLTDTIVTDGVQRVKEMLKEIDYPMMISLLFNAFVEKRFSDRITSANNFRV